MPKGKTSAGDDTRKRPAKAKKQEDDIDIDLDIDAELADINDDEKEEDVVVTAGSDGSVDLTGLAEVQPEDPVNEPEVKIDKPKKSAEKKVDKGGDCRECVNYPLRNLASVSGLADDLSRVTNKFTEKFCGIRPCDSEKFNGVSPKIDCRDKKFTPVEK